MNLKLIRYVNHHNKSTMGILYIDGEFQCYTLENPFRFTKMDTESRVPEGTYALKKREELSPMTERYRSKYPWFDYHIEVQDVPDFEYIYFHVGNQRRNTDGCILVGETADAGNQFIGKSVNAFERLYKRISEAFDSKEEVTLTIESLTP